MTFSFTLAKLSHVIIMYQYSGTSDSTDVIPVMRPNIDSVAQKHTVSLTGESETQSFLVILDCGKAHLTSVPIKLH